MGSLISRNTERADEIVALAITVQSDLRMRSRETQSSSLELTKRTVNIPVGLLTNVVRVLSVADCFLMTDYLLVGAALGDTGWETPIVWSNGEAQPS
jgi:hypothetical protein